MATKKKKAAKARKPTKKAAPPKPAKSRLTRPIQPMPAFVRAALEKRHVLPDYRARPDYQKNDYLSWITRAKREATQQKRLDQMLDELERGDVYMNMAWRA
jgi:uncharacterized protein YdeI (YjbR/CyaY-like superfamily)